MRMPRVSVLAVAALSVASLARCAPVPLPRPQELPFHSADQPPFTLHWRLDEPPGLVTAAGVVDIDGYVDRLADVTVELLGVEANGRVVSRARTRLEPRAFVGDAVWPFTLSVRPAGAAARFVVRVAEFNWRVDRQTGRGG